MLPPAPQAETQTSLNIVSDEGGGGALKAVAALHFASRLNCPVCFGVE